MKKKLLCIVLAGCLALTVLTGCGNTASQEDNTASGVTAGEGDAEVTENSGSEEAASASEEAEGSDGKKMIGIVPWDMGMAFESDLAAIAEEECAARGWESVVMDPKGDWAQMYTIIENLVTQGVDGIIYTAIDTDGANDAVALAHEAGIPIVD